jgi:hypothetical protein
MYPITTLDACTNEIFKLSNLAYVTKTCDVIQFIQIVMLHIMCIAGIVIQVFCCVSTSSQISSLVTPSLLRE